MPQAAASRTSSWPLSLPPPAGYRAPVRRRSSCPDTVASTCSPRGSCPAGIRRRPPGRITPSGRQVSAVPALPQVRCPLMEPGLAGTVGIPRWQTTTTAGSARYRTACSRAHQSADRMAGEANRSDLTAQTLAVSRSGATRSPRPCASSRANMVSIVIPCCMAMTLRLADDETEALRRRAELEQRSMQEVARQAIREYVENHSRAELLDRVLDDELPRYAEALERLGQ